jgi:Uma2 family endonuclease
MSSVSTTKMTARQFLDLGEDPPGVRLELVNGEIAVSPGARPGHSYVEKMLSYILTGHICRKGLGRLYGDVDTIFDEHDVRRPDLIFFATDRLHLVGEKAMEGPPDLCVEIVSEHSGRIDRQDKFTQYERGGVAHYWLVDYQERTVEAYRLVDGRYQPAGRGAGQDIVRFPPFDDLDIPLAEIWLPELPSRKNSGKSP